MISQQELDANNAKEFAAYDGSQGDTYNPNGTQEEFAGDQEEL